MSDESFQLEIKVYIYTDISLYIYGTNTLPTEKTRIKLLLILQHYQDNLRLDPVSQIPHAAPTTESPNPKATPKLANPYGDICVKTSAHP